VNDHRASNTVAELRARMGVIPASSILAELHGVCTRRARRYGALGDAGDTVLVIGASLIDT
jgi:hypothetical protein